MNNVIDFLRNARARKIYVILTNGGGIPLNYSSIIDANPAPDNVEDENWIFFHPGFLKAYRRVTRDILESIRDADPDLLNVVFSFDLFNELYFVWDRKPWTLESGDFQFAGKSYDMASPVDRQRLADQAAKLWANGLVRTVRSVSQDTMVTASVFTPNAVGRPGHDGVAAGLDPAERRVPVRARALSGSNLNYIDVHVYPRGPDYKIGEDLKSAEVPTLRKGKPLVMGEYGALKDAYPSIESATQAMDSFLGQSCRYDFDGWLYWTWDTKEQPELWYARETVGGQNMNMAIAPKYLPQICL
jgi:hypothetical protein